VGMYPAPCRSDRREWHRAPRAAARLSEGMFLDFGGGPSKRSAHTSPAERRACARPRRRRWCAFAQTILGGLLPVSHTCPAPPCHVSAQRQLLPVPALLFARLMAPACLSFYLALQVPF